MDKIKTTIWMPREQHGRLVKEADRRGWTMSYVINGLIADWLKRQPGKRAALEQTRGGVGSDE